MLQRYLDAATAFNTILGYIARCTYWEAKTNTEQTWTRPSKFCLALVSMLSVLCHNGPQA